MSTIRLYLDEDSQDQSLPRALRSRNVDILTVQGTQTAGLSDVEQLRLATQQQRVLYSHNIGDFYQIHTDFITRIRDTLRHCPPSPELLSRRTSSSHPWTH